MAHIRKVTRKKAHGRPGHAWQVRYRDPDRVERSRTFGTRDQAERFARRVEVSKDDGSYVDPSLGRTLFSVWAEEWLASSAAGLKPHTVAGYRSILRNHLNPALGRIPLAKVRALDVRKLVADLVAGGMSPSRVRATYFLLQGIMRAAVESGYIGRSPCLGVKLPRAETREMLPLRADEVEKISQAVPERYAALIYVLAYGGLRWGEAAALRRKRLNVLRHRLEVVESLSDVDGHLHFGSTKTHQIRQIAIPQSLSKQLLQHLEAFVDKDRNALVFTSPEGEPLRLPNFRRRVWWPALDKVGMPRSVRIHDLRHTCASLLIAEGTHPKAVQQHLGHSSISVTLDRYGHLFPDEQDRLAQTLDRLMQRQ